MGIQIQAQKYECLPTGVYPAVVSEIEASDGKFGPQLRFRFEVLAGDYEGRRLTAWCSAVLSPKSKLNRWAVAILGPEAIPADGMLDTDDLLNQKCVIELVTEEGKDGGQFNKVREVKPWRAPRPAAPKPAPKPTPTEDDDWWTREEQAATADASSSIF